MNEKTFIHAIIENARDNLNPLKIMFQRTIKDEKINTEEIEIAEHLIEQINNLLRFIYRKYENIIEGAGVEFNYWSKKENEVMEKEFSIIKFIDKIMNDLTLPYVLLQKYQDDNKKLSEDLSEKAINSIGDIDNLLTLMVQEI